MENNPFGGMAQLGARLTGSQKVRGSNPLISTKKDTMIFIVSFFIIMNFIQIRIEKCKL